MFVQYKVSIKSFEKSQWVSFFLQLLLLFPILISPLESFFFLPPIHCSSSFQPTYSQWFAPLQFNIHKHISVQRESYLLSTFKSICPGDLFIKMRRKCWGAGRKCEQWVSEWIRRVGRERGLWLRDDHRLVHEVWLQERDDPALTLWHRKLRRCLGFLKSLRAIDQDLRSAHAMSNDSMTWPWNV